MGLAQAQVVVNMKDGSAYRQTADVETPESDLARQWARLSAKFADNAAPVIGAARASALTEAVGALEECSDIGDIVALAVGDGR